MRKILLTTAAVTLFVFAAGPSYAGGYSSRCYYHPAKCQSHGGDQHMGGSNKARVFQKGNNNRSVINQRNRYNGSNDAWVWQYGGNNASEINQSNGY